MLDDRIAISIIARRDVTNVNEGNDRLVERAISYQGDVMQRLHRITNDSEDTRNT